jgi:hypothetical protein
MKYISDKFVEKFETHDLCSIISSFSENRAVYEIIKKNLRGVARHRLQYGAYALHVGYLALQTHKHSQYVILIVLPLKQLLHQRASKLHHSYITCIIFLISFYLPFISVESYCCNW